MTRDTKPDAWPQLTNEMLPKLISEWGVDADEVDAIRRDVAGREGDFAALDDAARTTLAAPFLEEVYNYGPTGTSTFERAAVSLVLRSSLMENAHAHGPIEQDGIKGVMTIAGPLFDPWLDVQPRRPGEGQFAGLIERHPVAAATLAALAESVARRGRRVAFDVPGDFPVTLEPSGDQLVTARTGKAGHSVLSGIDPRIDRRMLDMLESCDVVIVSSLSRLSRNIEKVMWALEFILSRDFQILTTNHWIKRGEVHTRSGHLIAPDSFAPIGPMSQTQRLSGPHRRLREEVLN